MTAPLPEGWTWARLKEVTEDVPNRDPSREPTTRFTYVDISAIDNKTFEIAEPKSLRGAEAPSRARRPVQSGDVLFSNVRTYLRNIARVGDVGKNALASTGFTVLRPRPGVDSDYLFFNVLASRFISAVTPQQTGSNYPATSDRVVRDQEIPLPPTGEQVRIGRRLKELDGRVRTARERLEHAAAAIRRAERQLLVAATTGYLSVGWREDHDVTLTDGEVEAARERRKGARGRFKEPEPNQYGVELEMPPTWQPVPLGLLLEGMKYGTSTRSERDAKGVPVLRIPNVSRGRIDLTDLKYAELSRTEQDDLALAESDLLLIRSNGSVPLVGLAVQVREAVVGMAFAGYLVRLRPDVRIIDPSYLEIALRSPGVRLQIEQPIRSTSGVNNINTEEVSSLVVPLPSLDEQRHIAAVVGAVRAVADDLDDRLADARTAFDGLSDAAFEAAVAGRLVTTEADLATAATSDFESSGRLSLSPQLAANAPERRRRRR